MSELAFDANGDPITFPAEAEELRVRRFRNPGMRGACEVVHDRDGAPLYVPIDMSYVELRHLVDAAPGRYRLDPVDAARRVIANALPAYITITESRSVAMSSAGDDRDSVIRELARANAEMTKTIADRFANVMQAAADLLRAADGAGLPRREPAAPPQVEGAGDDDDEQDDEYTSPDVTSLIAQLLPTIQMWLHAKAAEKSAATSPAAAPTSAPVSAPAPAPAAAPVMVPGEVGAAAGVGPGESQPAAEVAPSSAASTTAGPESKPIENSAARSIDTAADVAEVRNAAPATSAAQGAHLLAIYTGLSPDEKRVAQLVMTRMTPDVRAQWLAELSAMTVDQAVELVRSMMPKLRTRTEGDS
jgi:hypothetical protein